MLSSWYILMGTVKGNPDQDLTISTGFGHVDRSKDWFCVGSLLQQLGSCRQLKNSLRRASPFSRVIYGFGGAA